MSNIFPIDGLPGAPGPPGEPGERGATGATGAAGASYTDEEAQDAVGAILADTATIDFTYDDATPQISAIVIDESITYAKMQNVSAVSKLLGRGSAAGAGDVEEITLGTNLSMSGTTLNASGGGSGTGDADSAFYRSLGS